jgi:predicted permease
MAPVGPSLLAPDQSLPIDWRAVSPDFLTTMKIPLRSGRFFSSQDTERALAVTVLSQQTATAFWGTENPLGRKIRIVGSGKELTVIGVVGDVLNTSLNQERIPALYYSAAQRLWPSMDVAVRTQGKPENAIQNARRVLRELDPEMPLATVKTVDQWIAESAAQPRLNAGMVGLFAASALLIGVIGIYGVLSFSASQRTREIGVRLALGAQRANVMRLIFAEGMLVAVAGIGIGVAAAATLVRVLSSLLFGVNAYDRAAFVLAPLVLAVAVALACYVPAQRASRVNPSGALGE